MKRTELEWKARAIWSVWRLADRGLGVNSFTVPWSKLPSGSVKAVFYNIARRRRIRAVEIAWRSRVRNRSIGNRSPFREVGLTSNSARGRGWKGR